MPSSIFEKEQKRISNNFKHLPFKRVARWTFLLSPQIPWNWTNEIFEILDVSINQQVTVSNALGAVNGDLGQFGTGMVGESEQFGIGRVGDDPIQCCTPATCYKDWLD